MSDFELRLAGRALPTRELEFYSYFGFSESELGVLDRVVDPDAKAEPGFVTEPFGIRTRVANMWNDIQPFDGVLVGLPVPGNWHWEASEWLGVARSALQAQGGRYRVMELGAGWGPAAVGGAVMARRLGVADIRMTAVEADRDHFRFLNDHVRDNGFSPAEHALIEGAVGVRDGLARWPETEDAANTYGNRPMDRAGDYLGRTVARTRPVKIHAFRKLLRAERVWDLVHIDVQGGELDICRSALRELDRRVARVCVGLHSRKLDGDLYDLFWRAGWMLENESPTRMRFAPGAKTLEALNAADGTQIWRNPRLRPDALN